MSDLYTLIQSDVQDITSVKILLVYFYSFYSLLSKSIIDASNLTSPLKERETWTIKTSFSTYFIQVNIVNNGFELNKRHLRE